MKTAKEFRDFFAAIPDKNWMCGDLNVGGKCCALGHLGSSYCRLTSEAKAFAELLNANFESGYNGKDDRIIWALNDGVWGPLSGKSDDDDYNPKANVLAALDEIISKAETV